MLNTLSDYIVSSLIISHTFPNTTNICVYMLTSSSKNIFALLAICAGNWVPLTKASGAVLWCFLWENGWVNNRIAGDLNTQLRSLSRLRNSLAGFMISDESGNRFFPTAVTDYWQDKAACRHEDYRKRQISGLSSVPMVVIVRYLSSGPQSLYTMLWWLQTLKNMMTYTRCDGSYTYDE